MNLIGKINWSNEQIDYIKNNYSDLGPFRCSKLLNINERSVRRKAKQLNLTTFILWNDYEIDIIKKYYPEFGYIKCQEFINKKRHQIIGKAMILGIRYSPKEKIGFKICSICKIEKSISNLVKCTNCKQGVSNTCKECHNKKNVLREKNDINFRLKKRLRTRIYEALKGFSKSSKTMLLIGCNITQLKFHIQSNFKDGMSWDNYGEWHIDHIKPCAGFDLSNPEQQKICFHYTNLQPLWALENIIKGHK